jgi:hypothetical protein
LGAGSSTSMMSSSLSGMGALHLALPRTNNLPGTHVTAGAGVGGAGAGAGVGVGGAGAGVGVAGVGVIGDCGLGTAGGGIAEFGWAYPTVFGNRGWLLIRGSQSEIVFQSGKAASLPLAPILSLSSATQDKSRGENDVAALPCWANAVVYRTSESG